MDLEQLTALAEEYEAALDAEYELKSAVQVETEEAEAIKAAVLLAAYQGGAIDGKNADIRKQQEAHVLACNEPYLDQHARAEHQSLIAAHAENTRKALEARIGLVKAWLYSQARIG